ncbi:hypothetical protein ACFYNN_10115 [Streptomyces sp. NPDC006978]|uniref:hypothetical protein n=1 Tax=unclassified Streptomyces TaxID=2593676 RepID=UPI002AFDE04E|nr:hypothetical protein [Streptomyces sp. S584]
MTDRRADQRRPGVVGGQPVPPVEVGAGEDTRQVRRLTAGRREHVAADPGPAAHGLPEEAVLRAEVRHHEAGRPPAASAAEPEAMDLGAAALPVLLRKAAVPTAAVLLAVVLVRVVRRRSRG